MKRIAALLLVFMLVVLSGCALFEVPEEEYEEEAEVEEEEPEVDEEITEEPEEEITEEPEEEVPEPVGDVEFSDTVLPDVVDIIDGEAHLTLLIPYVYGDSGDKTAAVEKAVEDIRVTISGRTMNVTIESVDVRETKVMVEYTFSMTPATKLTRIMHGATKAISSRKRIQFLPKKVETTTTSTGPTTVSGTISDSFIRYGIPDIIKDTNNDRRLVIELNDQAENPFKIGINFRFGNNPTYQEGDIDVEFEWLMMSNADATVTYDMLTDYEWILFYPPYSDEKYAVAFSSETLKDIRNNVFKTTISPVQGVVASKELTTDASGKGVLDIGGEEITVDLKKIIGSSDPVVSRSAAEASGSSSNEIPVRFFISGTDEGLYFVEYRP